MWSDAAAPIERLQDATANGGVFVLEVGNARQGMMRMLLVMALLFAATGSLAGEAVPSIRGALEAADAASARSVPVSTDDVDQREFLLRELEFRLARMRAARDEVQQALAVMSADPDVDPNLPPVVCKAAGSTFRDPHFSDLVRGKLKELEKPKNLKKLTPEQGARLAGVKASLAELEARPDIDCANL